MKTRSPLFWALMAGAAVLVAAFAPVILQMLLPALRPQSQAPTHPSIQAPSQADALPAPWTIDIGPQGELRAFGLRLPGSTLAHAVDRWGDDLRVALIATRGQMPALEAFTDRWSGGGVTGKLVLATDAPPAAIARWHANATKHELIDANAQRWGLKGDDLTEALRSGITGLSFLPASRLDAAALQARFGAPGEVVAGLGQVQHWLYADRSLAISWDAATGKTVLQVVAAADFEQRLRAPVKAAAAALQASAPAAAAPVQR